MALAVSLGLALLARTESMGLDRPAYVFWIAGAIGVVIGVADSRAPRRRSEPRRPSRDPAWVAAGVAGGALGVISRGYPLAWAMALSLFSGFFLAIAFLGHRGSSEGDEGRVGQP